MDKTTIFFVELPTAVLCDILGVWIEIEVLGRLDSAYCCTTQRQTLLGTLDSKIFTFRNKLRLSNADLALWLIQRGIQVSTIEFDENDKMVQPVFDYLRSHGKSICDVTFTGSCVYMPFFSARCESIKKLTCYHVTLDLHFREVLINNNGLEHLVLDNVSFGCDVFNSLVLSNLKTYRVFDQDDLQSFAWSETAFSASLQRVEFNFGSPDTNLSAVMALVRNCPNLTSLSIPTIPNTLLLQIADVGRSLTELDICFNTLIGDNEVLQLVQKLPALRALDIQFCVKLTDKSLIYIAQHCAHLEVLRIDLRNNYSDAGVHVLETLGKGCPRLTVIEIQCRNGGALCDDGGTAAIVAHYPQLHTLAVSDESSVCKSSRIFVKILRPELSIVLSKDCILF